MNNKEFKIGDHILVQGNKGIVEEITRCKEYKVSFDGKSIGDGLEVLQDESAERMTKKGYVLETTGRTATYFKVNFDLEESLARTAYNHGLYGCLDEFENYFTW